MAKYVMLVNVVALASCYLGLASDPPPLQDLCVADLTSSGTHVDTRLNPLLGSNNNAARVNGHACKDPKDAQADDFFFSGLHLAGNTSNALGYTPTLVNAEKLVGLNTLGITMARLDFAPYGLNPPHIHPRATELLLVTEGSLEVGFVTSDPDNRHISKVLQKGDVFVFPVGLVHYQRNVNNASAVAIVGLSSQNPGVISISDVVFASYPKTNYTLSKYDSSVCSACIVTAIFVAIGILI